MTDSKFIDSSVLVAYLIHGSFKEILESKEMLSLSVLSLFEIKIVLAKQGVSIENIGKSIGFIKKRCLLINVDEEISELAAELSVQHKLPAVDSLIYASALRNDAVLMTLDNHFRGLKNVVVLG